MRPSKLVIFVMAAAIACCGEALAQNAAIPRLSRAPHSASRTFQILQGYFANNGVYTLVRADRANDTLVAKRNGIDTESWGEWAFCKMGPEHLLDSLEDGAVTLTVSIKPAGKDASEVSVVADFEATYDLGDNETTTQCVSRGELENQVLQAAGAAPQTS